LPLLTLGAAAVCTKEGQDSLSLEVQERQYSSLSVKLKEWCSSSIDQILHLVRPVGF